jgi:hypothetical protein
VTHPYWPLFDLRLQASCGIVVHQTYWITSAWHDNSASLGVSRALGYQPNGVELHPRGAGVDTMVHLRLTRADWLATPHPPITISGFPPCAPFFGL